MTHYQNQKTAETFWQKGYLILRQAGTQALYISILAFILPQILFEVFFAAKAVDIVEISNNFSQLTGKKDFYTLLIPAQDYMVSFLIASLAKWLTHLWGYLCLVGIFVDSSLGRAQKSFIDALTNGLKLTLKQGISCFVLYGLIFVMAQYFIPPLVLAIMPGVLFPVLIAAGMPGLFRPVICSLKMDYGFPVPFGKWALFFQLVSLGAFFYLGILVMFFLTGQILSLDTWLNLPNFLWEPVSSSLPVTPIYLASMFVRIVFISFWASFLAATTSTFYTWLNRLPSPGIAA